MQEKLYKLIQIEDITGKSLREIGKRIGIAHPQSVKYHLRRLVDAGFITTKSMAVRPKIDQNGIVTIPVLDELNIAGQDATSIKSIKTNLRVAKTILNDKVVTNLKCVYAVRAFGNFMNRGNIDGINIEDGDYVLIISSTEGYAAVRKYLKDGLGQVVLITESTQDYPPIYLDDHMTHCVLGKALQVIKKPMFGKKRSSDHGKKASENSSSKG
ncbi:MAG: hypothetical protein UW82_C0016G0009 [candidate division WWE3 bacterium GW2011_GWC2_44_9]|uniref:Peptidase S24/S26A/S26B/S26C domain-containing protein n=1 Tax=candidate division WWE3 bacterium GW2011_GWC2_44_9 TaxID=1619125 RepID=A0A0G1KMA1_UNCKA|nr:MAG: hypothetical protein UW82_C0016G0009 [candidate division WWE3 bacterium GW2011_GWC2_44_9]